MSELKTQPTEIDPGDFIAAVEHPTRRADAEVMLELMTRLTGWSPKMWGPSIIGYGSYRYQTANGKWHDFMRVGFSPRKANLVVYILPGYTDFGPILDRIGKYKKGKSCLYINKLADVDMSVLEELIQAGLDDMAKKYPL